MERSGNYTLCEANIVLRMLGRSGLQRAGKALPIWVKGDSIDLDMAIAGCTLLASSDDYFDGCHHWLYLLTQDGKLIDQLRMPDQFGYIEHVQVLSETAISFGYMGTNDRWTLCVDRQGFRSFSWRELVARPNRFLLARRHLKLHRTEGPPCSPAS